MHFDEENADSLTAKERDQIASLIADLEAFEARMAQRTTTKNPKAGFVPLGPDCKALGRLQLTRRTR
jgi:hypothetical protein